MTLGVLKPLLLLPLPSYSQDLRHTHAAHVVVPIINPLDEMGEWLFLSTPVTELIFFSHGHRSYRVDGTPSELGQMALITEEVILFSLGA